MSNVEITKNVILDDLTDVFGGEIPLKEHPLSYINARLRDGMVFLAKNDEIPAGFLIYDIWWGNCPFIELIKVKKSFQGQGVGRLLLETAKKELMNKKFKTLISSSEVINDGGQNFHEACGFKSLDVLDLPHGKEQFFKIELDEVNA